MTLDELNEEYGPKPDEDYPLEGYWKTHLKHAQAAWIIQDIYAHLNSEEISLGKARELTSHVIEKHMKDVLKGKLVE